MHEVSKRMLFRAPLKGGMSKAAINQELGISRRTATRWSAAEGAGQGYEALSYGRRAAVPSILDPYQEIGRLRLSEYPDLSSERVCQATPNTGPPGHIQNWATPSGPEGGRGMSGGACTSVLTPEQGVGREEMRMSGLPPGKTLDSFDWSLQPRADRAKVEELAACAFARRAENILWGHRGWGRATWRPAWG